VKFFPIVLFTYNRPEHTRRTIESLRRSAGAADSELWIFSDGPKNARHAAAVGQVRDYLRSVDGFRSVRVIARERNMGLAASVIAGTTEILEERSACIVMEDDMLSAPNLLTFMNGALETYVDRPDIFSVTGYNYPLPIPSGYPEDAYLSYRGSSWGWGTWLDRWRKVDWAVSDYASFLADPAEQALFARGGNDLAAMLKLQMEGKLDSWSIRFDYAHYKHNAFCLHAVRSKIQNIGFDGSGVHCDVSNAYQVELDPGDRPLRLSPDLQPDPTLLRIFDARFRSTHTGASAPADLWSRAVRRLRGAARKMLAGR
jgi:glycosyltransferase involved in cell wall biosynthesis